MQASMFVRVIKMIECIYDMFDPPSFSLQMSINLLFLLVHSLRSLRKKKKVYDLFCQWAMKFINNKNFFSSHRRFSLSLTHSLHSTLSMMFVDNANWINQLNKIYWFIIVSCCVCGNDEGISCCQKRVRILILLIDRTLIYCYLKVVYSINGIFIFRVKVGWNNTFFC